MYKEQLKKIDEEVYELPKSGKMLVPGRLFISKAMFDKVEEDALKQVANVATLPGIQKYSIGMSDLHIGYGSCIGGVAAFDLQKGIISPGAVGFDINCGVRLLRTNLSYKDVKGKEKEIVHSLFRTVPSGTGRGSKVQISETELNDILKNGSQWCVKKGYGNKEDYIHTEAEGKIKTADSAAVSERAKKRGIGQLGSLGSGNHFLEMQIVEKIFDSNAAKIFGLKKDQVTIMIHCGSRGLGHQVATDYIKDIGEEYGWPEQDRQLVNAPIKSNLGKQYLKAMAAAANFAFANRQIITHLIREDLKHYFPKFKAEVVYDIAHNMAKFEKHIIDDREKEVLVMRKGATRSFGPNNPEIPKDYMSIGQPIFIPGSMGTGSYVLTGTEKAEQVSFSSTAHGAGRVESRTQARKHVDAKQLKADLEKKGIYVEAGSLRGISEEAPEAYKDVDEVVRVSHKAGIGDLVVRLKPIAVVKG